MARSYTPVATFFVGVLLTVGVYETARAYRNAVRAWAVASGQVVEDNTPSTQATRRDARPARRTELRPRTDAPQVKMRPPTRIDGTPPNVRLATADAEREARRQALRQRLEEMSPEQRDELRARRRERKDRQRERLRVLRDLQGTGEEDGFEPGIPLEGEAGLDTADPGIPE